jgi:release factor glutamine methyltransferase
LAPSRAFPDAQLIATDISDKALAVARRNLDRLGFLPRTSLRQGDLFSPLGADEQVDLIVANVPYIPQGDAPTLMPEVRDHEPHVALFAGPQGMDVITRLVSGAPRHLVPGGHLVLEFGYNQFAAVADLIRAHGSDHW